MNVSVVGCGYVGITLSACLADLGHDVTAIGVDEETVARLDEGETTLREPGLEPLLSAYAGSSLRATTDYDAVRETAVTFLTVGAPPGDDGRIDCSAVTAAARSVGSTLAGEDDYHLVVVKSAVLPGTTDETLLPAIEDASGGTAGTDVGVAVDPEFQREGSAVDDFMEADRIVLGTDGDGRALDLLAELYEPLVVEWETPVVETGRREAEMIRYANNVFLASKVSLVNELGNVCKEYDVDAYEVADALGMDDRISSKFLRSEVGWGDSRFAKDTAALVAAARDAGYEPELLEAVVAVDEKQPERMLELLDEHVDVAGERVAVLGLAFEPGTDDTRRSRAVPITEGLRERGAEVVGYDPVAANVPERFPDVEYAESAAEALEGAVGALVVTDRDEFASLDAAFDAMAEPVVVDGRRIVANREGIVYEGLTW